MSALDAKLGLDDAGGFTLDVTLRVSPGVTVLFGPSGSGKSRTLGCIAGIVRPARGRIALGDDVWFDAEKKIDRAIHERKVAYVFQSLALFPHMTASENVVYGMARGGAGPDERRARARDLLARMHVGHLEDRRPRTFSGGEAQRVALARAFGMTPKVLLLDEPFSALDVKTKRKLLEEVSEWVEREKLPTILVTHAPEEARALGTQVLFIDKGRIVEESAIADAAFSASHLEAAKPSPP